MYLRSIEFSSKIMAYMQENSNPMADSTTLDEIDRKLLRALRNDGRMSNADLATSVGLSASACLRRVRLLEHRGIIRGYTALIDAPQDQPPTVAIIQITLERQTEDHLGRFEAEIRKCPEVTACYLMTGVADYLVLAETRTVADYERLQKEVLSRLPGVARIQSSFAMRRVTDFRPDGV